VIALIAALSLWAPAAGADSGAFGAPGFDGGITPDGNGLVVEPTFLYLGGTSPGVTLSNTFQLRNTETLISITVNGVYKPGPQCPSFTLTAPSGFPILMAPSQMDLWQVAFTATAPGSYSCHVEFQDTDGNLDSIDLQAQVNTPSMTVSPLMLDFGTVSGMDTRYFYISNNGSAPLTISSVVKTGSADFVMFGTPPVFQVAPFGGVEMFYVEYTPTGVGIDMGQVVITGDDPNNPSDTVTFSGAPDMTGLGKYLQLTPNPLAFGSLDIGDAATNPLSLSATGTGTVHVSQLTITGPGASSYTIESNGCTGVQTCPVSLDLSAAGSDSIVSIRCSPTSVGLKAAQLTTTSDASNNPVSASLSCTGTGADIAVSPQSLDFGTVRLGQGSILPLTVANNGNETLSYTFMFSGALDYSANLPCSSTCTLAPGSSRMHDLTFSPTLLGPRNASLMISSNDPLELISGISLAGIGGGGKLTIVQPASGTVAFGMIPVDVASSPQPIQLRNDGNLNLKVTGIAPSSMTAFGLTGTVPPPDLILLPNQSHVVNARCTPPDTTDYFAFVTVTTDAPIDPIQTVDLTCTGIDTDLVATPAPITFAATRLGDSDVVQLEIENIGASTSITSITPSPGVFTVENVAGLPISLGGGATTELDVRFTPTADGDVAGTLTVTASSGDPLVITLLGPGRVAAFAVTPPSYDFGAVCVGTTSVKRFSVTSTGSADIEVALPALVDPDVAFDLAMIDPQENEFPATITPSGTVTVDVTAAPTSSSAQGTLQFETDVDPLGDVDVPLRIVAISSGVGVGPAAVDFGPVAVDGVSTPTEVSLANCDVVPLAVSSVRITGEDADAFAVGGTLPPPELTVPVSSSVRWTVVFRPEREGSHEAALEIMHALGTTIVPLDGLGAVAAPDAGPGGEVDAGGSGFDTTSYYACACRGSGGAAGAAPFVLLVVAFGLRRRRRAG